MDSTSQREKEHVHWKGIARTGLGDCLLQEYSNDSKREYVPF